MPVAKKITTNNKTNKKVSLIQRLKLNTLKGRMLATVLVFAIVGGGVMVYRSFAATSTFPIYCLGTPTGPEWALDELNGCYKFTDQSKNSTLAWYMKRYPGSKQGPQVMTSPEYSASIPANQDFRICGFIKPVYGSGVKFTVYDVNWRKFVKESDGLVIGQSSSYSTHCSNWMRLGYAVPRAEISMELTSGLINITTLSLETKDSTPPAPAK